MAGGEEEIEGVGMNLPLPAIHPTHHLLEVKFRVERPLLLFVVDSCSPLSQEPNLSFPRKRESRNY
jgi:hypothetical protein